MQQVKLLRLNPLDLGGGSVWECDNVFQARAKERLGKGCVRSNLLCAGAQRRVSFNGVKTGRLVVDDKADRHVFRDKLRLDVQLS